MDPEILPRVTTAETCSLSPTSSGSRSSSSVSFRDTPPTPWEHSLLGRMEGLIALAEQIEGMGLPEALQQLLLTPISVAMLTTASDQGFKHLDWVPYDGGHDIPLDEHQTLIWDQFLAELMHVTRAISGCSFTGKEPRRARGHDKSVADDANYWRAQREMLEMVPASCWRVLQAAPLSASAFPASQESSSWQPLLPNIVSGPFLPALSHGIALTQKANDALAYKHVCQDVLHHVSNAMSWLPVGRNYLVDVKRIFSLAELQVRPLACLENQLYTIISDLQPNAEELSQAFSSLIDAELSTKATHFRFIRALLSYFAADSNIKPYMVRGTDGQYQLTGIDVSRQNSSSIPDTSRKIAVPFTGEHAALFTHQMINWGHKILYSLLNTQLFHQNRPIPARTNNLLEVIADLNQIMPPNWLDDFIEVIMDPRGNTGEAFTNFLNAISENAPQKTASRQSILAELKRRAYTYTLNGLQQTMSTVSAANEDLCFITIQHVLKSIETSIKDPRELPAFSRVIQRHVAQWPSLSCSERIAASLHCLGVYHHITLAKYVKCRQLYHPDHHAISEQVCHIVQTTLDSLDPLQAAAYKLEYLTYEEGSGCSNLESTLLQTAQIIEHWHAALEQLADDTENSTAAATELEWFNNLTLTLNNSCLLSEQHTPEPIAGAIKDLQALIKQRQKLQKLDSIAIQELLFPFKVLAADARFLIATSTSMQRWGALPALHALCTPVDAAVNLQDSLKESAFGNLGNTDAQPAVRWFAESLAQSPQSKTLMALMIAAKAQEECHLQPRLEDAIAYSSWIRKLLTSLVHGECLTPLTRQPEFQSDMAWLAANDAGALRIGAIAALSIPEQFISLLVGTTTTRIKQLFATAFSRQAFNKNMPSKCTYSWLSECTQDYLSMCNANNTLYKTALLAGSPWYIKHSRAAVWATVLTQQLKPEGQFAENTLKLLSDLVSVLQQRNGVTKNPLVELLETRKQAAQPQPSSSDSTGGSYG